MISLFTVSASTDNPQCAKRIIEAELLDVFWGLTDLFFAFAVKPGSVWPREKNIPISSTDQ